MGPLHWCIAANSVASLQSHLSKWPGDLKINGTQENVIFSGPPFHGLPSGGLLFDASVSFKNVKIEDSDQLLKLSFSQKVVFKANTSSKKTTNERP